MVRKNLADLHKSHQEVPPVRSQCSPAELQEVRTQQRIPLLRDRTLVKSWASTSFYPPPLAAPIANATVKPTPAYMKVGHVRPAKKKVLRSPYSITGIAKARRKQTQGHATAFGTQRLGFDQKESHAGSAAITLAKITMHMIPAPKRAAPKRLEYVSSTRFRIASRSPACAHVFPSSVRQVSLAASRKHVFAGVQSHVWSLIVPPLAHQALVNRSSH